MTDPTPLSDDMRIVAAIANKMLEWNQDGKTRNLPTRVAVHPSHLRRYTEILGLLVCHVPEMEPGTAALVVGERSSVNPGVVVRMKA